MADELNDVPQKGSAAFNEERLAELFRAQASFNEQQNADSTSRIDLVDGALIKVPRQMEKVREDQVQNAAGGFVFQVSDETRVRRFLILGSSSGTYYETAEKLTMENVEDICRIVREGNGFMVLKEVAEINKDNRNPKMSPMLFVLAICARFHVHDPKKSDSPLISTYSSYINELHKAAFDLVPEVCRIPTHLFEFVGYCETISNSTKVGSKSSSGWGRMMRQTITKWYGSKSVDKLAMFLTKYPQREGWSHRDLFRLAHPKLEKMYKNDLETRADRLELEQVYRFAVKGDLLKRKRKSDVVQAAGDAVKVAKYTDEQLDQELNSRPLAMIEAYLALKQEKDEGVIVEAIKKHGLVREHLPTDCLNSKLIWETLVGVNMPMTAMIRNLGKMTLVGALDEERISNLVGRLTNEDELKKARIHPMALLTARAVYAAGHGDKGSLTWEPDTRIVTALETGFYKSFCNAPATNKRYCLALDVSGSMCSRVSSSPLSCREAASAMSLINLRNEPLVECVAFCDKLTELKFTKEMTIAEMNEYVDKLDFGATDCGLPMLWAAENNLKFDVFIVYTDNDTWAGEVHPFEALKRYREQSGITDAKLIVMGMQASKFTIADPSDKGMLDVVGLDSAVPQIVHEFVTGQI